MITAKHKIFHVYKHKESGQIVNLVYIKGDTKHLMSESNVKVRKVDLIFYYEFIGKRRIRHDHPPVLISTLGGREEERVTKSGFKYKVFIKDNHDS
jgi:hypothetical protein